MMKVVISEDTIVRVVGQDAGSYRVGRISQSNPTSAINIRFDRKFRPSLEMLVSPGESASDMEAFGKGVYAILNGTEWSGDTFEEIKDLARALHISFDDPNE